MNLFFVRGTGLTAEIITPALTGTLLPGISRDCLLAIQTGHSPDPYGWMHYLPGSSAH